ncbi:MAG: membrane protein insertase YidC [Clostridiales bacterium]|nr:membrane protein insertase YidC [Clostridiales bacterium]
MSFLSAIYNITITPIEYLLEIIFMVANRVIGNTGLAIIFLSLTVNFLILPLYIRADELQNEEREIQKKMAFHIKNIKKTFKGNEQFLMLQEYYRINNYKPVYALKSTTSLLLQIPFFIAAYNLLSNMSSLQGMSFWFIKDLGKADSTFMIGSFAVNILPILMTLINIVSGIIYTKGHPIKEKIQIYGLALIFLVLLYNSPAGLVFYWLLNNVFSLLKNIFYKLKDPKKALSVLFSISGIVIAIHTYTRSDIGLRQKSLLCICCLLLQIPLLSGLSKKERKARPKDYIVFFCGALFLTLVTGFLIPSAVISDSTQEFYDSFHLSDPMLYVIRTLFVAFGIFVLWGSIFYFFMSDRIKSFFSDGIWIMSGVAIINYMLFGKNLGILSSNLRYDEQPVFSKNEYLINAFAVLGAVLVLHVLYTKFHKIARGVLIAGIITISVLCLKNFIAIEETYLYDTSFFTRYVSGKEPSFQLSKDGQNVIVIMLDRAVGPEVPYIMQEKPELAEKFDGFTYYQNTISFGGHTNIGAPPLFGGYEYTPAEMNKRDTELLEDKHNEALKVMPVLFAENGYDVTICDPPYAGYSWNPDLSIYDDYPEFNCYNTDGYFDYFNGSEESVELMSRVDEVRNRDFFFYSLTKISPLVLHHTLYNNGVYNDSNAGGNGNIVASIQEHDGISKSTGYDPDFLKSFAVLTHLKDMTKVSEGPQDTFLMMANDTTHAHCLLQKPDYEPALVVDNSEYDVDLKKQPQYMYEGRRLKLRSYTQVSHYHVNMATLLQLGEWFDYLREMGVYDNTRIILVSDHGYNLDGFNLLCHAFRMDGDRAASFDEDVELYMPLLMVKDFNATGFTISKDFMTNADTPTLATEGLIEDPTNPFTGKPINSDAKDGPQKVLSTDHWSIYVNNEEKFMEDSWFTVEDDPYKIKNWKYVGEG